MQDEHLLRSVESLLAAQMEEMITFAWACNYIIAFTVTDVNLNLKKFNASRHVRSSYALSIESRGTTLNSASVWQNLEITVTPPAAYIPHQQ